MYSYSGKTALITGASSGIGAVFARELAQRGMNVVLVARSQDRLVALAKELNTQHKVRVEVIAADLSKTGVANELLAETQKRNLKIDMLVNNAGFSTYGDFEKIAAEKEQQEIAVNIAALVDLTHAFLPLMLAKGEGAVINVASVVSFLPFPRQAVYGATKAFVLSFSEALTAEYRGRGIKIFALCPGATATGFFKEINVAIPPNTQTPEQVVKTGLKAFERGRHFVIPGLVNKIQMVSLRFLPRSVVLRVADNVSKGMMKSQPPAKNIANSELGVK